jgi:starch phosphorylase
VVRRYKEAHKEWDQFPAKVACQMNDTHPTIAVPELMRLLMDENKLGWTQAWELCTKVGAALGQGVGVWVRSKGTRQQSPT